MPKLTPDEELDRALRRLDNDAEEWKNKQRKKLIAKRDFQEKPLITRIGIRLLQTLGFILGAILVLSWLLGGSS